MSSQVYLNPTKLSILSIPKDKAWIFSGPILQMLHQESRKNSLNSSTDNEEDFDSESSSEEEDNSFNSDYCSDSGTDSEQEYRGKKVKSTENLSTTMSNSIMRKRSLSRDRSRAPVDNSSKMVSELTPHISHNSYEEYSDDDSESQHENYFFHVAFTPTECTVICSTAIMNSLFTEALEVCRKLHYRDVELVDQTFLNLQIDSDGSFDNARILELTQPLSENNISLFFLSSHFSDIVLIPYHLKEKVISILTKENFQFSDISNSYIVTSQPSPPTNPDTAKSSGLEQTTFKLFLEAGIKPKINSKVKLLLTGARSGEVTNSILKSASVISSHKVPEYFAITRTSASEVSLILPKSSRKRKLMGFDSSNIIGSAQDIIIPITIDLTKLPLDSTGIVAGLASKLINGVGPQTSLGPFEMNYLSMARSAIVMIPRENLPLVSRVLKSVDYKNVENLSLKVESLNV